MGSPKRVMMSCPDSATNLKASDSTLPSCAAPDTKSRYRTKGSPGTTLGEDQIPCLSLDHYRSDPARVDWRSLEYSDLSPLARKEGKCPQCVASLAALDLLLERKRGATRQSMPYIGGFGICNIHITCSVRVREKRAHRHAGTSQCEYNPDMMLRAQNL